MSVSVGRMVKHLWDRIMYRKSYGIDMWNTTKEGEEKRRVRKYFTVFSAFGVQKLWFGMSQFCV